MADVRLVDLEVFKRYSLAIRQESAPVEEVLAVLDATRRQVASVLGSPPPWGGADEGDDAEAFAPPRDQPDAGTGSPEPGREPDSEPGPEVDDGAAPDADRPAAAPAERPDTDPAAARRRVRRPRTGAGRGPG